MPTDFGWPAAALYSVGTLAHPSPKLSNRRFEETAFARDTGLGRIADDGPIPRAVLEVR